MLVLFIVDQVWSGKQVNNRFKKETWVLFVDQIKMIAKFPNLIIIIKNHG